MLQDEIYVKIAAGRKAFVYTVVRGGHVVESGAVEADEEVAPGYYGGSEVMD